MKPLLFSFFIVLTLACKSQPDTAQRVNPATFEKAIHSESVQVLDVRTAGEFYSGHIKNSLLADWNDKIQFNNRIQYVDKDRPVYIYCLVGGRSAAAAEWMRKNGYNNVVELQGGINAWKRENKPLEGKSEEKQMTQEEYQAKIPKDKITLVDFGASWCPPCVKMEPVLDKLQKDTILHFQIIKVDAGVHTDLMKALGIDPIPVFIVYKNGKETWRKEGIVTREELIAQLK